MSHLIKLVAIASTISVLVLSPVLLYQHSKINFLSARDQEHSQLIENLTSKIELMTTLMQTQNLVSDQANISITERGGDVELIDKNSKFKYKCSRC